jgi:hypothetical protein
MSEAAPIHCYQYVNRPYAAVSRILVSDPVGLFQRATVAASGRAESLVARLEMRIAGFEIGKNVRIEVTHVNTEARPPRALVLPATSLELKWHAATNEALFPSMQAELLAYPLSADETQLALHCHYAPPGGLLGSAADALLGHRIAEASVHRFLEDIVACLRALAAA